jgi:hypothetical protein
VRGSLAPATLADRAAEALEIAFGDRLDQIGPRIVEPFEQILVPPDLGAGRGQV